ncbi:SOS response-associated peptidase [Arthrobacter agilis]|uniref:SOS response-associated peptidase n=1 Tax=Arthrobacter agilis TaxID=37921 RepID=UPI0023666DBF|nr:SOS response-associated peptidase [Arthrobacter agilis]WDF34132.1 SOS response-associated peptidase [Arthrobacter agilis]
MCGRFVIAGNRADLIDAFEVDESVGDEVRPSWNVAPTDTVQLVVERLDPDTGELTRRLEPARWGLIPSWATSASVGSRMINARSETLLEKPSFRSAALKRRGLVPADGYYEWRKNDDGSKTPIYLHGQDAAHLGFAGIYEFWRDPATATEEQPKGTWVVSCSIITRPASDTLGEIHDRTPVIVPPGLRSDWLDPRNASRPVVQELLDAIPDPQLVPRLVGPRVGSVRNDGPELIEPLPDAGADVPAAPDGQQTLL